MVRVDIRRDRGGPRAELIQVAKLIRGLVGVGMVDEIVGHITSLAGHCRIWGGSEDLRSSVGARISDKKGQEVVKGKKGKGIGR